jgi:DNA-binding CsgD family transcriptional regulator
MFSGLIYSPANTSLHSSTLFYTTHIASVLLAVIAVKLLFQGVNIVTRKTIWASAILMPACALVLISAPPLPIQILGCVLFSGATGLMVSMWFEALSIPERRFTSKAVPLGYFLAALFSIPFLFGSEPIKIACVVTYPILSGAMLESLEKDREAPGGTLDIASFTKSVLRETLTPFIGFFSLSSASIAVSNMILLQEESMVVELNYSFMIGAIALGALTAFFLPEKILTRPHLPNALLLVTSAALLLLPFSGPSLQIAFEVILTAEIYLLSICVITTSIRATRSKRAALLVLGCIFYALIAASLLFGSLVVAFCSFMQWTNDTQFAVMVITCTYLLLAAIGVYLLSRRGASGSQTTDASGSALSVPTLLQTKSEHLAATNDLSPREAEVLLYLAMGRSDSYIAEVLFISKNTVKGHIKNIYRKLNIHSKQELLDLFQNE